MPPRPKRSAPDPLLERRRSDFGALVRRALDAAKLRNIPIRQIEEESGINSSTFYGWRDGRWTRDPVATLVYRFTDYVGLTRAEVNGALRWSEDPGKRTTPAPIVDDPDVALLMRKLSDPRTSAAQKLWIRRQVRALADAPTTDEE